MRTPIIVIALLIASCSPHTPPSSQPAAKEETPSDDGYKKLDLTHQKPAIVGTEIHASSAELPAGKSVELQWGTVKGGWVIEDYYHFKGKKFTETTSSLGKFNVDTGGRLEAVFKIPEDYGGRHDITSLTHGT